MKSEKSIELPNAENSENNLGLREVVEKYLSYWKWFLLSIILSVLIAFFYLNFKRPIYEANATIKIKNEQAGDRSTLSAFQDLGITIPAYQNVEDEMEVLLSKDLISQVIKSLNLNVQFFSDKNSISEFLDNNLFSNTNFYETELYLNQPLKINFFLSDSVFYSTSAQFLISINSTNKYTYTDLITKQKKSHAFGEKITTNFGDIIITPNLDLKENNFVGSDILVNIVPVEDLTNGYAKQIVVEPISEFSSVLSLTISSGVKEKSEDFLNELIQIYNDDAIKAKDLLTKNTADFVSNRLEIISEELANVDLSVESIKTRYRISDEASRTGLNMQSGQEIENQIVQTSAQIERLGFIKDFVNTKSDDELIPVDVGVTDNNLASTIEQYNQLMLQKKKLLETSTEKNPIVVNLNEQLTSLNNNIVQGLDNIESSQKISLEALNRQDQRINSRLYSAPKQERQYRNIQRQQQIKEQLYLYLLQKREETAISIGVADSNAKIIDQPRSLPDPIAPKRKVTLLGFILLGFLIPIGIIYTSEVLDTKIHSREDVEKVLNIPIIGDIPKLESKTNYLIKKNDYSSIAEAFRILRTNLNFISPESAGKKGKIFFVTSTIAHEGKSFVASNLATAFAHAGKKTLLIGMDIRAPKIKSYLGVRGVHGLTNYIINPEMEVSDITVEIPEIENLELISSGDIAPNPAELLMKPKVKELFDQVREKYEYVIVDTAAFSMVTDTLLLSGFADAFIYVLRANFLDKRMLNYIKFLYKEKRLPNLALLINGVDYKKSYGYGYGYGYGTDFEKAKQKKWWKFN